MKYEYDWTNGAAKQKNKESVKLKGFILWRVQLCSIVRYIV